MFLSLGHIFVALGVAGLFIPILPTTPFLLVALWCYGKSSEKFRQKLLNHPKVGPLLRDWSERGIIRRKSKVIAICFLVFSLAVGLFFFRNVWYVVALAALYTLAALFILTRPSE